MEKDKPVLNPEYEKQIDPKVKEIREANHHVKTIFVLQLLFLPVFFSIRPLMS